MGQSNPVTFAFLQDLAQKTLDTHALQLKKAYEAYQNATAQLRLLESYYVEYQQKLADDLVQGTHKNALSNFQFFINTVEKSIEQQKRVVASLLDQRNRIQQDVYRCQKKVNAYATLQEKQNKIVLQKENKLLQKQTDEFAQNASLRKSLNEY